MDYCVEAIGNREFGSCFLGANDNVALAVVANGWAKVRRERLRDGNEQPS